MGFRRLGDPLFRRGIPDRFALGYRMTAGGIPGSAPTAAMGWRAYWNVMDGASVFSDAGITPAVNNDLAYQLSESLGVVANSYFRQTTAGNRPTFKTGGAGGKSYLQFDGVDNFMTTLAASNFLANNAKTILVAGAIRAGSAANEELLGDVSGYFYVQANGVGDALYFVNYDINYDSANSVFFIDDTAFVFSAKHESNNLYGAINGGAWTAGVASGNTGSMAALLNLGFGSGVYCRLDLYAMAMANVVISDANLALCTSYFKSVLGI